MTNKKIASSILVVIVVFLMFSNIQCGITTCIRSAKDTFYKIEKIFDQNTLQAAVDDIVKLTISIPLVLKSCGDGHDSQSFQKQLPDICIKDLGEASKIAIRMLGETQNQIKFALDVAILGRLFQRKLKKQCPFLEQTTIQSIPNMKSCIKATKKLSKIYDKANEAYEKSDYKNTVDLSADLLIALPGTLEACGQTNVAGTVRTSLPDNCIKGIQEFGDLIASYQQSTNSFEWLTQNIMTLYSKYYEMKDKCPIFQDTN